MFSISDVRDSGCGSKRWRWSRLARSLANGVLLFVIFSCCSALVLGEIEPLPPDDVDFQDVSICTSMPLHYFIYIALLTLLAAAGYSAQF